MSPTVFVLVLWSVIFGHASGLFTLFSGQSSSSFNIYCANNYCGNMTYNQIYLRYPGLFFTQGELQQYQHLVDTTRQESLKKQGYNQLEPLTRLPGDGDACCATDIVYLTNTTMENIHGDVRDIVHMSDGEPPHYQFIPHAVCEPYGVCKGECFLEPTYLSLLVYDVDALTWPPLTFDWFQVPGYCSCKSS